MTQDKNKRDLLLKLARSLALAADSLAVNKPSRHEIDEAFREIVLCFCCIGLSLELQFDVEVKSQPSFDSERYLRIEPDLHRRIDEFFSEEE